MQMTYFQKARVFDYLIRDKSEIARIGDLKKIITTSIGEANRIHQLRLRSKVRKSITIIVRNNIKRASPEEIHDIIDVAVNNAQYAVTYEGLPQKVFDKIKSHGNTNVRVHVLTFDVHKQSLKICIENTQTGSSSIAFLPLLYVVSNFL